MKVTKKKLARIAIFTIDPPEAMNLLSTEVYQELRDGMLDFQDNPDLWVAILTGAGNKSFSAGQDIKGMSSASTLKELTGGVGVYNLADTIWKPFIAAINGYCFGGGLELALTCDLRIAAENARFGLPEANIGLIPGGGGTQRLVRFIPRAKVAEILLMGRHVDAQEAYRIGLVNKVVPLDQLMPTAMEWAETICQAAPLAVSASKEALIRGYSVPLEEGLRLEKDLVNRVMVSEDRMEGVKSFVEKRRPIWKGK
ncbi:enoyl-CoA hydratase/isomerase family protein [Chloroflexota bacterium]